LTLLAFYFTMVNHPSEGIVPLILIDAADAPRFTAPGLTVTGLASPSRGATETSAWRLVIEPGSPGAVHQVTREEVFVAVRGTAVATVGDQRRSLSAGSALVVPAHTDFSLANPGSEPFEAVAVLPVGGAAVMGGETFTPPWAA
jgi:quercetin dioxygenase-like cupin family protein